MIILLKYVKFFHIELRTASLVNFEDCRLLERNKKRNGQLYSGRLKIGISEFYPVRQTPRKNA